MLLFLLVFVTLYGGMNYYLFRKVHAAWPGHAGLMAAVGVLLLFMISAPILVRVLEREGLVRLGRFCAFVGHAWVAIIFWFVVLAFLGDLWNLGLRISAHWRPGAAGWLLMPRPALALYGVVILAACLWGLVEAASIRVPEVHFRTPKLAPGAAPVRIVVISDIHLSLTLRERRLGDILRKVEQARPDVLVSLGDLTDLTLEQKGNLAQMLAEVRTPLGKFAILGNHEFYTNLRNSVPFTKESGFRLLRGESAEAGGVVFAGVDDIAGFQTQQDCFANERSVLDAAGNGRPIILLKHRPHVRPESAGRFDLQLSGHTHGGQIFPFHLLVRLFHPVPPGMHPAGRGSWVYTTRGSGTWGPPFRLFAPPEVTLIVVEPE